MKPLYAVLLSMMIGCQCSSDITRSNGLYGNDESEEHSITFSEVEILPKSSSESKIFPKTGIPSERINYNMPTSLMEKFVDSGTVQASSTMATLSPTTAPSASADTVKRPFLVPGKADSRIATTLHDPALNEIKDDVKESDEEDETAASTSAIPVLDSKDLSRMAYDHGVDLEEEEQDEFFESTKNVDNDRKYLDIDNEKDLDMNNHRDVQKKEPIQSFRMESFDEYMRTQENLSYSDNSLLIFEGMKDFLNNQKYKDLFDEQLFFDGKVFETDDKDVIVSSSTEKEGDHPINKKEEERNVTIGRSADDGFLWTGKSLTRTPTNCYVLRTSDDLTSKQYANIEEILRKMNATIKHRYKTTHHNGFAACFPDETLPISLLKSIKGIKWVERDQFMHSTMTQTEAPWNLARLSDLDSNDQFTFMGTGAGINVYVLDSGVNINHPEFEGRASIGYTIFPDSFSGDCAGHGTEVTSVIGGINVGVAKQAKMIAVQVLDCDGQAENSGILAGLNWIIKNHQKPAVINMSIGGPRSPSVDDAVRVAISEGISVIVAAGNSSIDACELSPSGIEEAMVVGASTFDDHRADFSNFGKCLDVFAPGENVVCATLANKEVKNGYGFASGTSLSAPLVAGIYALFLESDPTLSPSALGEKILELARSGILSSGSLKGSPNQFVQVPLSPARDHISGLSFAAPGTLPVYGQSYEVSAFGLIGLIAGAIAVVCIILILLLLCTRRVRRRRAEQNALKNIVHVPAFQ